MTSPIGADVSGTRLTRAQETFVRVLADAIVEDMLGGHPTARARAPEPIWSASHPEQQDAACP